MKMTKKKCGMKESLQRHMDESFMMVCHAECMVDNCLIKKIYKNKGTRRGGRLFEESKTDAMSKLMRDIDISGDIARVKVFDDVQWSCFSNEGKGVNGSFSLT